MYAELAQPSATTALLLVDLQEEHRGDPRFLVAGYDVALANARRLLAAARAGGVAVYHAEYVRNFATAPPRPFEVTSPDGAPEFSDAASPLVRLCPEVAPRAGETIITKQDASSFKETDLGARLKAARIEWLVVAGTWTEACVAASVRDATAQGLRVLLVKDACASGTALMHQSAILNLANRLLGGAVTDTESACALLAGQPRRVWRFTTMVPFRYDMDSIATLYAEL